MNNSGNMEKPAGRSVQKLFQTGTQAPHPGIETPGTMPNRPGKDDHCQISSRSQPPHRPPPPSHPQGKPEYRAGHDRDADAVRGPQSKDTLRADAGFLRTESRLFDYPHGNFLLVSPEKNELLSRFMESHTEMRNVSAQEDNVDGYEKGGNGEKTREKEKTHTEVKYGVGNWIDQPIRQGKETQRSDAGYHEENFVDDNRENIVPEKDLKTQQDSPKQISKQHHGNVKGHIHHHSSGNRKHRRPPPPSYGPLHPPVMSSTQKSSEIADFVSVTSTEVSAADYHRGPNDQGRMRSRNHELVNGNSDGKFLGKTVEFSENPHGAKSESVLPQEEDFLEKYRKVRSKALQLTFFFFFPFNNFISLMFSQIVLLCMFFFAWGLKFS